jgi:hypothetical protein
MVSKPESDRAYQEVEPGGAENLLLIHAGLDRTIAGVELPSVRKPESELGGEIKASLLWGGESFEIQDKSPAIRESGLPTAEVRA